ncbi:unnamed protein product [Peronospora belbahrii]|uniref:SRR1-like domain-containing protein n=1 Tax=Peronospora belbahrii TaxID=622444 RepID=A0ABN8D3F4_9STRA|nr:unnamed protein product [Peronospora belbahrii]
MEQAWQQISRRRRGNCRHQVSKVQFDALNGSTIASNGGEEMVEPVPEVSKVKQLQIIQRVRAIADVLRDSLLIKDTRRVIVDHFNPTATKTLVFDEETGGADEEDETFEPLMLIGYGLGSFCASSNAVHQLGFLIALKRALDETCYSTEDANVSKISGKIQHGVEIFDPAMNKVSKTVTLSLLSISS